MNTQKNIPDYIEGYGKITKYNENAKIELGSKAGAKIRTLDKNQSKISTSLRQAIEKSNLKDSMTISFHHHLRNGDYVINMVLDEINKMGIKDLTLAVSSLSPCHDEILRHINDGVITSIQTSGLRGKLGEEISKGILKKPVVIRSHGGRARAIENGQLKIDVAFIAAPSCDEMGNISGSNGQSSCGSLGYAIVDAMYANYCIAITDNLVSYPNVPCSIKQNQIDTIVQVEKIGDPQGIVYGAIKFNDNPRDLIIAKNALKAIMASGYYKNGFVFQTGAAGSTLAVAKLLKEQMEKDNIKSSIAIGGITSYMVDMLNKNLVNSLMDTQSFDLTAVESIKQNEKHIEISASEYANPNNPSPMVDMLDFVLLGALEIDVDYNVNVMTRSDGVIAQAIGGHQDTANGAKMTIVLAPLVRKRNPIVVDKVTTVCTPSKDVDVLCTEYGISVNPKRKDLIEKFEEANIELVDIKKLKEKAIEITGIPDEIEHDEKIVAVVEYRDSSIIDVIYKVKE